MGTHGSVHVTALKLSELRPGMENVLLEVELLSLEAPREVETHTGLKHTIVEGVVQDASGSMGLTVWNEKIGELEGIKPGDELLLIGVFVSSYKGELSANVGRDSNVSKR
jgi:ssDNA-binding replication factor A large subunit